jgi:hypothetical protein
MAHGGEACVFGWGRAALTCRHHERAPDHRRDTRGQWPTPCRHTHGGRTDVAPSAPLRICAARPTRTSFRSKCAGVVPTSRSCGRTSQPGPPIAALRAATMLYARAHHARAWSLQHTMPCRAAAALRADPLSAVRRKLRAVPPGPMIDPTWQVPALADCGEEVAGSSDGRSAVRGARRLRKRSEQRSAAQRSASQRWRTNTRTDAFLSPPCSRARSRARRWRLRGSGWRRRRTRTGASTRTRSTLDSRRRTGWRCKPVRA